MKILTFPIAIFKSELWTLTIFSPYKIDAFEITRMITISWKFFRTNNLILQELSIKPFQRLTTKQYSGN